jgi:hypothetical protein
MSGISPKAPKAKILARKRFYVLDCRKEQKLALKPLNLSTFLSAVPEPNLSAPCLFHTTKGQNIYKILEAGKLQAQPCPVFDNESLLYLFVGRPAYKLSDIAASDYWLTPLVFVFRNPVTASPKRVFPFDSGAFKQKKMGEEFADFELDRFELEGDYAVLGKIIKVFFGSVSKYLRAEARNRESVATEYSIGPKGFVILALSSLLMKPRSNEADDRASAIELQFDVDLSLNAPDLKGVVIAEDWLDDPDVKTEIDALNCIVETYPLFPLNRSAYHSKIYEACDRINNA